MTKVYDAQGIQELDIELGPNEFIRSCTWTRNGQAISVTGINDGDSYVSESCEIIQIVILTYGGPGSCQVDIWRAAYGSFPPTVANTIFSSGKPAISNANSYSDTTLTGVSKNCSAGDVLRWHLDSNSVFTRVTAFLVMRET